MGVGKTIKPVGDPNSTACSILDFTNSGAGAVETPRSPCWDVTLDPQLNRAPVFCKAIKLQRSTSVSWPRRFASLGKKKWGETYTRLVRPIFEGQFRHVLRDFLYVCCLIGRCKPQRVKSV